MRYNEIRRNPTGYQEIVFDILDTIHGYTYKDKNDCCCCIFGLVAEAVRRWLLHVYDTYKRSKGTVPGKRADHIIVNEAAKQTKLSDNAYFSKYFIPPSTYV